MKPTKDELVEEEGLRDENGDVASLLGGLGKLGVCHHPGLVAFGIRATELSNKVIGDIRLERHQNNPAALG